MANNFADPRGELRRIAVNAAKPGDAPLFAAVLGLDHKLGQIVARVLQTPALRAQWAAELDAMRVRIAQMRQKLHDVLSAKLPGRDFSYFLTQRGMFSYTGLTAEQVDRLREDHGVYLVRSGRMCVAGLNSGNVEATAVAMAAVLA